MNRLYALCIIIVLVSFLGFLVENIWLAITKGYMDNRNMCLPFLLGYGLAVAAIYLLFGTPAAMKFLGKKLMIGNYFVKLLLYFLVVMVCVSVGEIILGTAVEKAYHIIWWDYTRLPLHVTRYTSVPTSMGFSLLIMLFMNTFFDPLMDAFLQMELSGLRFAAVSGICVLTADFLYNAVRIYKEKEMKPLWRIEGNGYKKYGENGMKESY